MILLRVWERNNAFVLFVGHWQFQLALFLGQNLGGSRSIHTCIFIPQMSKTSSIGGRHGLALSYKVEITWIWKALPETITQGNVAIYPLGFNFAYRPTRILFSGSETKLKSRTLQELRRVASSLMSCRIDLVVRDLFVLENSSIPFFLSTPPNISRNVG